MTRDVLITGGAGFIGYHLASHLHAAGERVTLCDNLSRGAMDDHLSDLLANEHVSFVECDLTDPKALNEFTGYDHVYHLAAIQGTENFYDRPKQVLKTNVLTTMNLLDWVIEADVEKVFLSSSSETYAGTINEFEDPIPTPEDVLLSIQDVFNPRWSYAGSKITSELLFTTYGESHDFDYIIGRYHNIYGPRMGTDHVVPEFALRALNGDDPFTIYGGDPTRAFCYVDDAVDATRLLMESNTTEEIVHIGNDKEEIKIRSLAERVLSIVDHDVEIEDQSAPEGSVTRRCPDTSKLESLGYEPDVPLDEGLRETITWYRKECHD